MPLFLETPIWWLGWLLGCLFEQETFDIFCFAGEFVDAIMRRKNTITMFFYRGVCFLDFISKAKFCSQNKNRIKQIIPFHGLVRSEPHPVGHDSEAAFRDGVTADQLLYVDQIHEVLKRASG